MRKETESRPRKLCRKLHLLTAKKRFSSLKAQRQNTCSKRGLRYLIKRQNRPMP
jgi:hypothetical protein